MRDNGDVPGVIWADAVAALHLAAIAFMLTGGLLGWRWPRLLWVHAPIAATILGFNVAGADCPLTTLELHLRQWGGEPPYTGGFIGHYLVQPIHPAGITPGVEAAIYAIAITPNVVGYGVLAARWLGVWNASAHPPDIRWPR
jgi:Protein of Unknown function (DUF2784)